MSLALELKNKIFKRKANNCPIVAIESENPYRDYFELRSSIRKGTRYLVYDSFHGGYYPHSLSSESKIKLGSLDETIKYFYAQADLDTLVICINDYNIDECTLNLLSYFLAAPKTDTKCIGIILKSSNGLVGVAEVLNKVNRYKYISKLVCDTEVVGLNGLRSWLTERKVLLTGEHPVGLKGISILGIPGSGKTVSAQLAAEIFKLPAYKFNIHTCLGKYVGDSEANTELAFKEISALGKCVILLDEVDKVFNNNDDNQTTSRVLSILLNYMDLNKNVFWVLTGNNVSDIPPELLRKGRLDEYFYVGLPDLEAAYIYIQKRLDEFAKYGYINQDIDAKDIASMLLSYNYTFSDIVAHCDKLYVDFKNYGNDACLEFKPVSSYDRNKEAYDAIMKWSEKNAKSAN